MTLSQIRMQKSWEKISPTWPLQNIIACNPLQGFENLKFSEALQQGCDFFKIAQMPPELEKVNQITIKWCQVFFDAGQATIKMPQRHKGFYQAWKELAIFDDQIHLEKKENITFLQNLSSSSSVAIAEILSKMNVAKKDEDGFLLATLSTLSGWSSYVKYLGEWSYQKNEEIENDYLAIRLAIIAIIWRDAAIELPKLIQKNSDKNFVKEKIKEISANENQHRDEILKQINHNKFDEQKNFDAQLVFCIDVRSEPFRKALESCGKYQTFGFAGFFGVPTSISNSLSDESYASCPVLLTPKHHVIEKAICSHKNHQKQIKGYSTITELKKFYQSLKYNFTTPLPLAEAMGIWSGGWMFIKTFSPKSRKFLQKNWLKTLHQNLSSAPEIDAIPISDQCNYAAGALKAIGLVDNFSEIIVLCGHGSQTENNTYKTALDCGACGGRHGDSNAKILAKILNQNEVRKNLKEQGINIPQNTKFIAAKHNTTTDEVEIYHDDFTSSNINKLKDDLLKAREINNAFRAKKMDDSCDTKNKNHLADFFFKRSHNWSETRPEWGLARNASFIVAPRSLTKNINLEGRSFLHSYDWQIDEDESILNLILNAPMVVAQWINSQYLFSTIDNVAFGSGSKITQNIAGKIGVMQGNASDLMHGLPLQSVYINDQKNYHQAARLATFIYAPSNKIDKVLYKSPKIQQLIVNEWIKIYCLDPRDLNNYQLQTDLTWKKVR